MAPDMVLDDTSITGRWFIDSDVPLASEELTREIRDVDMLPANAFDRKQLGKGLAYRAVSLRGARLLPIDPPESYAEDDYTDAHDLEDPFDTRGLVELPQNWAGSLHHRVARAVERGFELWEPVRVRLVATAQSVLGQLPSDPARAPSVRFAAIVAAAATALVLVGGMAAGLAVLGSTIVRADDPPPPSEQVLVQQRALRQLAVEWARGQGESDMVFTVEEVGTEPVPETSAAEQRRVARADRAERRRHRARRRRARRR